MAKSSDVFSLGIEQAELDFVDIELTSDTQLYICPYAIQIRDDDWSGQCGDNIRSFFGNVLDQLRDGNIGRVEHLLSHLHEPNETFLGESSGLPEGRGVGNEKARQLAQALRHSRAFATGVLADISEAELFIHGVGRDTISDLTTNVLRGLLADYTAEQCELLDIPVTDTRILGPVWDANRLDWEAKILRLPRHNGMPILLVPKFSVRRRLSLDSQEFYNKHMVEFLQEEYLNSTSALVQTLKDGRRRVTKKSVKERHPFIKNELAAFVRQHPEVLDRYKELKGAVGPMSTADLEEDFNEAAFAGALIDKLNEIPAGSEHATNYHRLAMGICTFLFYPYLIRPVKEFEQHDGRKRVDIKYTNAAETGFFQRMLASPQTRAMSVMVECKNYTREMNNPELDQLAGRFGHQRGFLGLLLCRNMDNRQRIVAGCRDTASDGRGFMLALDDTDLIDMLKAVCADQRSKIDDILTKRFDEISN